MLGHCNTTGRQRDGRRGGNVDAARTVAAGAAGVEQGSAITFHGKGCVLQCAGGAGDLGGGFALFLERKKNARDLVLLHAAGHDGAEHFAGFIEA